jgi:hypothetical protein
VKKLLCKAQCITRQRWYHGKDAPPGTHHPCPLPAKCDGYCDHHHPAKIIQRLQKRLVRYNKQIDDVNCRIEAAEGLLKYIEGEGNPS